MSKRFRLKNLIDGRRIYSKRTQLPPGAVAVACRNLAKYTPPGSTPLPHGVPPVAIVDLPSGRIDHELFGDDDETLRVLPWRMPWSSRAHALILQAYPRFMPVIRTVQAFEIRAGELVVVKL